MISIIVPIYNSGKTINRCVGSIVRQSFNDIEIILVDDGSTDDSLEVCQNLRESYNDRKIRVFSQTNKGPSAARNKGIQESDGEYIVFLDSDDYWADGYLEYMYEVVQKYGEEIIPIARVIATSEKDKTYKCEKNIIGKKNFIKLYKEKKFNAPVNKIYRKDIIDKYNIQFDESISLGEDLIFNLDYLKNEDVKGFLEISSAIYYYDIGENGLATKYRPDHYSIQKRLMSELKMTMEFVGAPEEDYDFYEDEYCYNIFSSISNTMHPNNPQTKKEKIAINNYIMRNEDIKKIVNSKFVHDAINPISRLMYYTNNYANVMTLKNLKGIFYTRNKKSRLDS